MALAIIYSRATNGIHAPLVTVETHISYGLAGFYMVGLPETAVKESRDRVRSALMNTGFEFPSHRITVNLAPADLPKEGSRFDLPIALGILAASGQLPRAVLMEYEFIGELALSGELRPVRGVLPVVLNTLSAGRQLIVPKQNTQEAALIQSKQVFAAEHLLAVCSHLKKLQCLPLCELDANQIINKPTIDMADIKGQTHAKRALEIAAAGRHNLLFMGPPGTGKTMLSNCLPSILPPISDNQALEVAAIASVSSNGFDINQWRRAPFRAPHHTSSNVALVGGGQPPKPGEISLAHHGVLFLDELTEFKRHVLECLRQPLEAGAVTISRAACQVQYPAQFQLVAAMNPCPCGYAGSYPEQCQCQIEQIKKYRAKISGPLLDRLDMHVEVARIVAEWLAPDQAVAETSAAVRFRVVEARKRQETRQQKCNALLTVAELNQFAQLEPSTLALLNTVVAKFNLSARVYHRLIKLALTIADLSGSSIICDQHLSEALTYRCLDKTNV